MILVSNKQRKHAQKLLKRIRAAAKRKDLAALAKAQDLALRSRGVAVWAAKHVATSGPGALLPNHMSELDKWYVDLVAQEIQSDPLHEPGWRHQVAILEENGKRRLIEVPTFVDRARQRLHHEVLTPEYVDHLEDCLYAYIPYRRPDEAIIDLATYLVEIGPCLGVQGDIKDFFHAIDQHSILEKLGVRGNRRTYYKQVMQAPVILEGGETVVPTNGVGQGGVLGPLFANVAMNGVGEYVREGLPEDPSPLLVIYADDFLILHPDGKVVEAAKARMKEYLAGLGLRLHPQKTRPVSIGSSQHEAGEVDFIGWRIWADSTAQPQLILEKAWGKSPDQMLKIVDWVTGELGEVAQRTGNRIILDASNAGGLERGWSAM